MYNKYNQISAKKILSHLNLDKNTDTEGSFDRYFWSWKKKDFQDSTLSFAVLPLINSKLLSEKDNKYVLKIAIYNLLNIQKKNGSFDQSYPNENHPKTGLDFGSVYFTYLTYFSDQDIENSYRKLLDFSLKSEENYGIICNHLAHHMYEYLLGFNYFKDLKYYEKAKNNLLLIFKYTSKEGWHQEYLGADAGYQTRTLRYIVKALEIFQEKEKALCMKLAIISTEFLNKLIMPDGTIYSSFGSRNTSLIYPSGIEFMAYKFPEKFSNLCLRIRDAVKAETLHIPLTLEFDNFIRLFNDFQDAQQWYSKNIKLEQKKEKNEVFEMLEYGLKKFIMNEYSIFIHYKYGGQILIYKDKEEYYKNAGYLIKYKNTWYGTKNLIVSPTVIIKQNSIIIRTKIFKSIHQEITPFKQLILRLLNLTILRFSFISDLFRAIIVKILISGEDKTDANFFIREINIFEDKIVINDNFETKFIPNNIYSVKYLNLFHMASSRYFNPVDVSISNNFKKSSSSEFKTVLLKKENNDI